jgi:hypothetical protein
MIDTELRTDPEPSHIHIPRPSRLKPPASATLPITTPPRDLLVLDHTVGAELRDALCVVAQ